eukprot:CAMPEP_0197828194 /NCGR_PEP_ID=MMETSP1437-20131217/4828_1 /TAXON_ID=49252 ORGANISM="Eucampia antarctica, Strain CCMP1452" /NCGR_SAMPLE_ID=MMETSP1437 /ASSEMBLY_ACC=CAM_ASM_001096 /LENGTH=426 /DNA_ID=CAMNT_0043429345 /DNA_START=156 /DNA_END=1436 /DNA_ORIENTATION=+
MSSNTSYAPTEKTCVIIGGGMCGQNVATALVKHDISVIIVQANAFSEQPVLQPWFLTRPEMYAGKAHTKKGSVANLETVGIEGVRYVVGTVVELSNAKNQITFADGRKLDFGVLVIAAGNHYPALMAKPSETFDERLAFVKAFPGKVRAAKSILVGGAGPVALEVASELRRVNPDCKIQLVTSGTHALGSWTGTPRTVIAGRLAKTNIGVVAGARVVLPDDGSYVEGSAVYERADYKLSNGKTIKDVDIFLPYFGISRTGFLPSEMTSERGRVKVNAHGQSSKNSSVFAVGCSDKYPVIVEPVIVKEAAVVVANIISILKDGTSSSSKLVGSLPELPGQASPMYVHLGLGQYTAMNLEQKGCVYGLCGRCCGCCNPFCPCCACLGWPCMFPASECQGKCFEKILISIGNMHPIHPAKTPVMAEMVR